MDLHRGRAREVNVHLSKWLMEDDAAATMESTCMKWRHYFRREGIFYVHQDKGGIFVSIEACFTRSWGLLRSTLTH
jgi:hypothetical protein